MCPKKKVLSKQLPLNWLCMMIAANCIFNRIILWCLEKESWKAGNKLLFTLSLNFKLVFTVKKITLLEVFLLFRWVAMEQKHFVSSRGTSTVYNFESKGGICRSKHFHSIMFRKSDPLLFWLPEWKKTQRHCWKSSSISFKLKWLRELNYNMIIDFCISKICYGCMS